MSTNKRSSIPSVSYEPGNNDDYHSSTPYASATTPKHRSTFIRSLTDDHTNRISSSPNSKFTNVTRNKSSSNPSKKPRIVHKHKTNPRAPHRNLSTFVIFANERRQAIKEDNPSLTFPEIQSILAKQWRMLSDKDKKKYQETLEEEKVRYLEQMKLYKQYNDQWVWVDGYQQGLKSGMYDDLRTAEEEEDEENDDGNDNTIVDDKDNYDRFELVQRKTYDIEHHSPDITRSSSNKNNKTNNKHSRKRSRLSTARMKTTDEPQHKASFSSRGLEGWQAHHYSPESHSEYKHCRHNTYEKIHAGSALTTEETMESERELQQHMKCYDRYHQREDYGSANDFIQWPDAVE